MKRHGIITALLFLFAVAAAYPQVPVNSIGARPASSAVLDVSSADKGLLIPRMQIRDVDSDLSSYSWRQMTFWILGLTPPLILRK